MLRQASNYSNLPLSSSTRNKSTKDKVSSTNSKSGSSHQNSSSITIKFVGNTKENIRQIVASLNCSEYCRSQISQILQLYASKITKIRQQRDYYKKLASMQEQSNSQIISKLRKRVEQLEQINFREKEECSCANCTCLDEHEMFSEQYSNIQQNYLVSGYGSSVVATSGVTSSFNNIDIEQSKNDQFHEDSKVSLVKKDSAQGEESILIEHDSVREQQPQKSKMSSHISENLSFTNELQQSSDNLNEQDLMKMMLKYNFSIPELQQILEDYQNEHKLVYQMFDSQEQRDLYILGQKMHKSFRNKKMLSDVKKLSMMKSETLNRSPKSSTYSK